MTQETAPRFSRAHKVLGLTAIATFLVSLDTSIVVVAERTIADDLGNPTWMPWVFSGYSIAYAAGLLTAGRFADVNGRKRSFMRGLALFSIGSVLCGLAPTTHLLVLARLVQAIGGAQLTPASLALVLPEFPAEKRTVAIGVWGAVGGAGGFVGLTLLYYGLANGSMTVVAPLTAVVSTIVPVAAGLGFGERPGGLAYAGMVVALAGVVLVTGAIGTPHTATRPFIWLVAIGSGAGFGWLYVCLDRTSDESGMWPLLGVRIASISLAAIVLSATRPTGVNPKRVPLLALVAGVFDMGANLLFLAATREGLLSLVAVITSLYPVSTIVLAMRIDRERVTRSQVTGMLLAGLALALVSVGR